MRERKPYLKYSGRVYESVSYECTLVLGEKATLEEIQKGIDEVVETFKNSIPTARMYKPVVRSRYGSIMVEVEGVFDECYNCGDRGHDQTKCPKKF